MHTEAIPDWRTQCTKGVIYYTELTIPRTITASLSNRLKMASPSVYAQTQKHTGCTQCMCVRVIQAQIQAVQAKTSVMRNKAYYPQIESLFLGFACTEKHLIDVCISAVFSFSWGSTVSTQETDGLNFRKAPKAKENLWNWKVCLVVMGMRLVG